MVYQDQKNGLIMRYNFTENGYREKCRYCKPDKLQNPDQFIYRMKTYLEKWVELSPSEATYQGLRDLIIKEQVLDSFPEDLSIHLHERSPATLDEVGRITEQYLKARGRELHREEDTYRKIGVFHEKGNDQTRNNNCYKCDKPGHRAVDCKIKLENVTKKYRCYNCNNIGHRANECEMNRQRNAAAIIHENSEETEDRHECSAFNIFPNKYNDFQIEYSD